MRYESGSWEREHLYFWNLQTILPHDLRDLNKNLDQMMTRQSGTITTVLELILVLVLVGA